MSGVDLFSQRLKDAGLTTEQRVAVLEALLEYQQGSKEDK